MIKLRLWHESLLPHLPREQLLGQHRECCALRGNGWGKPHRTVNYVFGYDRYRLFLFHACVMDEMEHRGYNVDQLWRNPLYRGKICNPDICVSTYNVDGIVYPEHNETYLKECLDNLRSKWIIINPKKVKNVSLKTLTKVCIGVIMCT